MSSLQQQQTTKIMRREIEMKYELKISQPEFHEILLLENTKKKSPNTILVFCFRFPFIPRIELSRSLISRLSAKCSQIYLNVFFLLCEIIIGDDVEGIFGTKKSTANKS